MSDPSGDPQREGQGQSETGDEEDFLSNPRLAALVEAITDGKPVDWREAEAAAENDEERKRIRSLEAISEIATFHRDWFAEVGMSGPLDEEEETAEIPDRWGELEILERIGRGSFGDVYKAREPRLDRIVALKLIRPSRRRSEREEETLREGRLLARVRHPNVATVHGAAGAEGRVGFWMEYLEGKNLSQLLEEKGPFEARKAAEIGVSLCCALMAVHGQGIVHRDVKAQNVVREDDGRIVLTDFGVGRDVRLDGEETSLSGTPLYLAPELFEGDAPSPASDLYALGVLLYFLVTGEFPLTGDSLEELRSALRERRRRWLKEVRKDLPGTFVAAVERVLARDPEKRGDVAQLERELLRFLGERFERKRWLRRSLAATALLTCLAAGIFGYVERRGIWARWHVYLADRFHAKSAREDAIRELNVARSLDADLPGIYWRLMSYQSADGDYDAALGTANDSGRLCANSLSRDCDLVRAWRSLLHLDYQQALEYFERAKRARSDKEVQDQIVQLQVNLVHPQVAIQEALRLGAADGTMEALTVLTTLSAGGKAADALAGLEKQREKFGNDPLFRWTAGEVLTAAGRYEEGEGEFRLMADEPGEVGDVSIGQLRIANSLMLQGKCGEAEVVLVGSSRPQSQKDFARNDAIRALLLAKCSVLQGGREEASRELSSIERLQPIPTYLKIFRNAGLEALEAHDVGLASRFARIVIDLRSNFESDLSASFDFQLRGEIARENKDYDQALSLLGKALEKRPDPLNLLSMARFHVEIGQCSQASKYWEKLIQSRGLIVNDFYTPWTIYNDALELKKQCSAK